MLIGLRNVSNKSYRENQKHDLRIINCSRKSCGLCDIVECNVQPDGPQCTAHDG